MSTDNKILRATGLLVIEVINSNPNGDPDRESDPRQRPDGRGEISPVSFKRKLRDLVDDKQGDVWQTMKQRFDLKDEEFAILESRDRNPNTIKKELKDGTFIKKYWDGRIFGNTYLEKAEDDSKKMDKSTIKTGVVQFGMGISVSPIDIERHTNTKVAPVEKDKSGGMAPLGYRVVKHGVYWMPFFVNPSMAHKSDCKKRDIELLKALIPYAYPHNRSAIRPFVDVRQAWYCEHQNPLGSCSDFALVDALKPRRKENADQASDAWSDYIVAEGLPPGLKEKVTCIDLMANL
jgi:Cas7 group CRISPR-associated protein Csh2